MRTRITLACTECKQRNYNMTKEKKNQSVPREDMNQIDLPNPVLEDIQRLQHNNEELQKRIKDLEEELSLLRRQ